MIFLVSSKATSTRASGFGRGDLVDLGGEVGRVGGVELLGGDVAASGLDALLDLGREQLAVGVLAGQDRDVVLAVTDHGVGHHGALEDVGGRGAEVQVLRVGLGVVERGRGVRRRELHDTGAGDLVDHAERHRGRGGTDDHVGVRVEELVGLGARDVGGAVTGVRLGLHDVLAHHAAGGVDVVDGGLHARELRRAEEGQVAGLREQGADREGAVALLDGCARAGTTSSCRWTTSCRCCCFRRR